MAGWQHGSKHAEVWRQSPLSPWEQNQNKWPPLRADVTVCDGDCKERPQFTNYCSSGTQTVFANMFNWKKNRTSATPCQNVQVWNLYGIWKIFPIPYTKSSIPYLSPILYSIPIFSFHSIPFLTIVCPDDGSPATEHCVKAWNAASAIKLTVIDRPWASVGKQICAKLVRYNLLHTKQP